MPKESPFRIGSGGANAFEIPERKVRMYFRNKHFNDNVFISGMVTDFTVSQFASPCGANEILICDLLVHYLQVIRNHFNAKITITSGFRSVAHNGRIGGATRSRHLAGKAVDFRVAAVSPRAVQEFARELGFGSNFGGLGLGKTFTHIDTCINPPRPNMWNY